MDLPLELTQEDTFPGVYLHGKFQVDTSGNYIYVKQSLMDLVNEKALAMIIDKLFGESEYGVSRHPAFVIAISRARTNFVANSSNATVDGGERKLMVQALQRDACSYIGWSPTDMMRKFADPDATDRDKIQRLKRYLQDQSSYQENLKKLTQAKVDMLRIIGGESYAMALGGKK